MAKTPQYIPLVMNIDAMDARNRGKRVGKKKRRKKPTAKPKPAAQPSDVEMALNAIGGAVKK